MKALLRKHLFNLSLVAIAFSALVLNGCAKSTASDGGKSTAVAPANIKAAAVTGSPNSQTAILVSNVALYYTFQSTHFPQNYASMLSDDGGCQIASDFSDSIGPNDLLASVAAYCTSATPQSGSINCARARTDAQAILTYMQQINNLCATSTDAAPYGYGDTTLAGNLVTAGQSLRLDLGMSASQ